MWTTSKTQLLQTSVKPSSRPSAGAIIEAEACGACMESQAVGEGATYPVDEVASNIAVQQITPEPGSHPACFNDGECPMVMGKADGDGSEAYRVAAENSAPKAMTSRDHLRPPSASAVRFTALPASCASGCQAVNYLTGADSRCSSADAIGSSMWKPCTNSASLAQRIRAEVF